jgi:hypothetical protein
MVRRPSPPTDHRIVIGIRHTLKILKNAGLVEVDTLYPADAVGNLHDEILSVAQRWYKVGARRGALRVLKAFLDGKFEVTKDKHGQIEIVARANRPLSWSRPLNVTVGNGKRTVQKTTYKLTLKDLEFDL